MNVKVEKQPKATIKLIITVPTAQVRETYDEVLANAVKKTDIPGFRKGMAPKEVVREKLDASKLYSEVVNELLQKYYAQALKENHIAPVSNPRVEVNEFDLDKDFVFTATVAIRPDVKVGDYRKRIKEKQEHHEKESREENARKLAAGEKIEEAEVHLHPNEVIDTILETAQVDISDMLIDDEVERMMARLVDQAGTIGLSLEQYLKAQNKTADQLRDEYKKIAERTLMAEFVLAQLVKDEKVEVSDKEIEETVVASGVPNPVEYLNDPVQKWYIKSVLEKNKLINNLIEEVAHKDEKHK